MGQVGEHYWAFRTAGRLRYPKQPLGSSHTTAAARIGRYTPLLQGAVLRRCALFQRSTDLHIDSHWRGGNLDSNPASTLGGVLVRGVPDLSI